MAFTVLRILNESPESQSGEVVITAPQGWELFTFGGSSLTIPSGDSAFIPIRLYIPRGATGGVHYTLAGAFRTRDRTYRTSAFFHIPRESDWDIRLRESNIYFDVHNTTAHLELLLQNRGNVPEVIRLDAEIGALFQVSGSGLSEHTWFFEIRPGMDSLVRIPVQYKKDLSYQEEETYRNNWRNSVVNIRAFTFDKEETMQVRLNKLPSHMADQTYRRRSPLNLEYQAYNLLSQSPVKSSVRAFGLLLLPERRELDYTAGIDNLYYNYENRPAPDPYRQLRFDVNYRSRRTVIRAAHNNQEGDVNYINGWGIKGYHQLNDRHALRLAGMIHPVARYRGFSGGWDVMIRDLEMQSGLTYEDHPSGSYRSYSLMAGPHFNIGRQHRIGINLIGSGVRFRDPSLVASDTSVLGLSYRLRYLYKSERWMFSADNLNSLLNYTRSSGRMRLNIHGRYLQRERLHWNLHYTGNIYRARRFPIAFYTPPGRDLNDHGRLQASFLRGRKIFMAGPVYSSHIRRFYDPLSRSNTVYRAYYPGIRTGIRFMLDEVKRLYPYTTLYQLRFRSSADDPGFEPGSYTGLHYEVGMSYFDPVVRVSAFYQSGSSTDLFRNTQINDEVTINQSLQIRPSFEKFLYRNSIRLSGYASYMYYMPSGRENLVLNLRGDFDIAGGWFFYLSGNTYTSTRRDEEAGRITTKAINFFAGIRKAFDIQHPRISYHDLHAVFFNDLNGNGIREEEEPPVPNIMVSISRLREEDDQDARFVETNLISSLEGEVSYEHIPEGRYDLTFLPLDNLEDLYFPGGLEQRILVGSDNVQHIPLAESYKVKGRIIMQRDPNSSEGRVSLQGIKVTATSPTGESYSVLTDQSGYYLLPVPQGPVYTVKVSNVFGEQFQLLMDSHEVRFTDMKSINLDFKFIEKEREIRIREGEEFFEFRNFGRDTVPDQPLPQNLPMP